MSSEPPVSADPPTTPLRTARLGPSLGRSRRMATRRHFEEHAGHRANWLRAAVLGANDGLLSTSSLLVGVASADASSSMLLATGVAALVAGAGSMAIGEYSSVSSQRDAERADLAIEASELRDIPGAELRELAGIYQGRGLSRALAQEVAEALTAHDALTAHARDELGIDPGDLANPLQAAVVSAVSFALGAIVPIVFVILAGTSARVPVLVVGTLIGLGLLGAIGARIGGAPPMRPALRVLVGGAAAMAIAGLVGQLFHVSVT